MRRPTPGCGAGASGRHRERQLGGGCLWEGDGGEGGAAHACCMFTARTPPRWPCKRVDLGGAGVGGGGAHGTAQHTAGPAHRKRRTKRASNESLPHAARAGGRRCWRRACPDPWAGAPLGKPARRCWMLAPWATRAGRNLSGAMPTASVAGGRHVGAGSRAHRGSAGIRPGGPRAQRPCLPAARALGAALATNSTRHSAGRKWVPLACCCGTQPAFRPATQHARRARAPISCAVQRRSPALSPWTGSQLQACRT